MDINLDALRQEISSEISKAVDNFVLTLKKDLLNPTSSITTSTGVADKVKNWWYTMLYGREGKDNPYKNLNKFGNLGIEENRLTLQEYATLQTLSLQLESNLLVENNNLALVRVIDNWSKGLKKHLNDIVTARLVKPANQQAVSAPSVPGASTGSPANFGSHQQNVYANHPDFSKFQSNVHSDNPNYEKLFNQPASSSPPGTASNVAPSPASTGSFENLSPEEKNKWNEMGGGLSNDYYFKRKAWGKLPWILRKDDPRVNQLRNDKGNHTFNKLKNQNRIEGMGVSINSPEDLAHAVAAAKHKNDEHSNKRWVEKKQKYNQLIDAALGATSDPAKQQQLQALKDEMDLKIVDKTLKYMGFSGKDSASATAPMHVSPELAKTIPSDYLNATNAKVKDIPEKSHDLTPENPENHDDSNVYTLLNHLPDGKLELQAHAKKIYNLIKKGADISKLTSFLGFETDKEAKEDIMGQLKNLVNKPDDLKNYLSYLNTTDPMPFETTTQEVMRFYKFLLENRN